jgi:hypothetical protein
MSSDTSLDLEYSKIIKNVLDYIRLKRLAKNSDSILDLIFSFAFENNLDLELVGDAISQDINFKELIQKDMNFEKHNIKDNINDW